MARISKSGVVLVRDKASETLAALESLTRKRVLVGVPATRAERRPGRRQLWDRDGKGGFVRRAEPAGPPPTNALLGYVHEFGSPAQNIPARPFLVPGVRNSLKAVEGWLRKAAQGVLGGDPSALDKGLHAAGLAAQSGVRAKITAGPFEPLKPATLAARRRRGRSGDRPLIDTAQLRNAITYVIRAVGG